MTASVKARVVAGCGAYAYGTSQHLPGLVPQPLPEG
jgi:hypothetical protein